MAWIEVHQSLPTHRKTLELAAALNIPIAHAVGIMVCLWLWALDNCNGYTGVMSPLRNASLAAAARWEKDPEKLVSALLTINWMQLVTLDDGTERFAIHDWGEYVGKLTRLRESNKDRQRRFRERSESDLRNALRNTLPNALGNENVTPNVTRYNALPNQTGPDRIRKEEKKEAAAAHASAHARPEGTPKSDPEAAAAAPALTPEWGQLRDFVAANRPRWSLTPAIAQKISDAAHESSPELVLAAVQEAVDHNADTWEYAARILGRWRDAGITTLEDAWLEMAEFKRQRDERHYGPRQPPPPEKPIRNSPEFEALLDGPDTPFRRD